MSMQIMTKLSLKNFMEKYNFENDTLYESNLKSVYNYKN